MTQTDWVGSYFTHFSYSFQGEKQLWRRLSKHIEGRDRWRGGGGGGGSKSRKMWVKMVHSVQTSQEQGQSLLHEVTEHQQHLRLV